MTQCDTLPSTVTDASLITILSALLFLVPSFDLKSFVRNVPIPNDASSQCRHQNKADDTKSRAAPLNPDSFAFACNPIAFSRFNESEYTISFVVWSTPSFSYTVLALAA